MRHIITLFETFTKIFDPFGLPFWVIAGGVARALTSKAQFPHSEFSALLPSRVPQSM